MRFFSPTTRRGISDRSSRQQCRPQLELLEDRCLLSAGALDPTFGSGGIVITPVHKSGADVAYDVLIQPDSKIVAAGGPDFSLVRHNPNGSLDTSFGSGGKVVTAFGVSAANAAALYPSGLPQAGKIVLAGWSAKSWTANKDFALVRYNANGSVDTSFGNRGKVLTDFGGYDDQISGIALQSDGKIVVAGTTRPGSYQFALARYNANGTLDSSFGSGGKVITNIGPGDEEIFDIVLQGDGKVVVAGYADYLQPENITRDFVVARYSSVGSLDRDPTTGFGPVDPATGMRAGFVSTDFADDLSLSNADTAHAVAVQPDGKIVAGGSAVISNGYDFGLARYNVDGSLDPTFGDGGKVLTDFANQSERSFDLALQPNGKIVQVGSINDGHGFAVVRYEANGALDLSFGSGGKVTTIIGTASEIRAVGLQSDAKIVAAGYSHNGADSDFTLARYEGDAPLQAASAAPNPTATTLSDSQPQPLLTEAIVRWQAAGADVSGLGMLDIRITDLGGTTLGLASGHTIWLDDNAAGWGWFVDPTPWDDSEFTTPGDQGEMNRIDLLTVLAHEIGHLLGHDHEEDGVMADTLGLGERHMPGTTSWSFDAAIIEWALANKK